MSEIINNKVEILLKHVNEQMIEHRVVSNHGLPNTYKPCLKRFLRFLSWHHHNDSLLDVDKYKNKEFKLISQANLEDFYKIVIPTVMQSPQNMRKHDFALQKLINLEFILFETANNGCSSEPIQLLRGRNKLRLLMDVCYQMHRNNMHS